MVNEILLEGRSNAIPGRELCRTLRIDGRSLRIAIFQERQAGYPICSSTGTAGGYFLAATKGEMEAFCRMLSHLTSEITRTQTACKAAMEKLPEA